MHETAKRLLEIGIEQGAKDFTEIAKRFGGSDQSATNWKSRGVPARRIIQEEWLPKKASEYFKGRAPLSLPYLDKVVLSLPGPVSAANAPRLPKPKKKTA